MPDDRVVVFGGYNGLAAVQLYLVWIGGSVRNSRIKIGGHDHPRLPYVFRCVHFTFHPRAGIKSICWEGVLGRLRFLITRDLSNDIVAVRGGVDLGIVLMQKNFVGDLNFVVLGMGDLRFCYRASSPRFWNWTNFALDQVPFFKSQFSSYHI